MPTPATAMHALPARGEPLPIAGDRAKASRADTDGIATDGIATDGIATDGIATDGIAAGHRILFLDHEDASRAHVHRELEAMGHKVAWIGMASEERAGVAFRPDLVVINPDVSNLNRHAFITMLDDEDYSGALTIMKPSVHFPAALALAEQSGIGPVDHMDGPYDADAITKRLVAIPKHTHDSDMYDQRFLSWLIQQGRLLPNLTHEFHVKRDLRDDRVAGYETLTRLRNRPSLNPEHIFAPSTILSLEVAATLLAVEAAAALLSALDLDGRAVPVAVNCSAAVLTDPDFIVALPILLRRHRVAAGMLSIELTEISYPGLDDRLLENMRELGRIGVPISLDDFGKGATNFDRISELPISEVKIDRKIFQKCRNGEFPVSLLREIVDYCRSRTIGTVIEGIETDADLILARSLGADWGQGFYWGKPVPAQTILSRHGA
ncbi:EAL domain-containing protein [Sphingomonas faeni]|uniref:EAL domain-containing protein n=1 Tax=Sphingomonas faeni TaxID=185950 RepID=UPI0020C75BD7|nr:EAL domain-containing protein [Sphingomonas faeni]MCP8892782.1 EAL domain-containing protein [Sphingomonas faeni]